MHKTRDSPASVRIARMLRELAGPIIEEVQKEEVQKAPDSRKRFLRRTLAHLATATRNGR